MAIFLAWKKNHLLFAEYEPVEPPVLPIKYNSPHIRHFTAWHWHWHWHWHSVLCRVVILKMFARILCVMKLTITMLLNIRNYKTTIYVET